MSFTIYLLSSVERVFQTILQSITKQSSGGEESIAHPHPTPPDFHTYVLKLSSPTTAIWTTVTAQHSLQAQVSNP